MTKRLMNWQTISLPDIERKKLITLCKRGVR
jgi:hypothetical protein